MIPFRINKDTLINLEGFVSIERKEKEVSTRPVLETLIRYKGMSDFSAVNRYRQKYGGLPSRCNRREIEGLLNRAFQEAYDTAMLKYEEKIEVSWKITLAGGLVYISLIDPERALNEPI